MDKDTGVTTDDIDEELIHTVADGWSRHSRFSSTYLPLHTPARPTVRDDAVLSDLMEQHLLPRFRLLRIARLAPVPSGGFDWWRASVLVLAGLAVACAAVGDCVPVPGSTRARSPPPSPMSP
ncbi:hypothetical protein ACR6C2_08265 [Streptomyces sp. INA 01156]